MASCSPEDEDWPTRVDGRLVRPSDSLWSSSVAALIGEKLSRGRQILQSREDPSAIAKDTAGICKVLRESERDWKAGEPRKLLTAEEVQIASYALARYGFKALWPPFRPWDSGPDPRAPFDAEQFSDLRSRLHPRLNRLRHTAATGTAAERRQAVSQLQELLAALVPEQRGKGQNQQFEHDRIVWIYYDELLRWQTIRLAAAEPIADKTRTPRQRLEALANIYDEPIDAVLRYLRLSENLELRPGRRPPATQQARTRAAQRLGITEATLQKLLSGRTKKPRS